MWFVNAFSGFKALALDLMAISIMASTRKIRLLVVEDNLPYLYLIQRAFSEGAGHIEWELAVANDGEQALRALFGEEKSNTPLPEIILLDWNLPKVSGLEVLHREARALAAVL